MYACDEYVYPPTELTLPEINDHQPIEREDISMFPKGSMFVLRNVLSSKECQHIIDWGQQEGYVHLNLQYRTCNRIERDSPNFAALLYERVKPFMETESALRLEPDQDGRFSSRAVTEGGVEQHGMPCEDMLPGQWNMSGLNPRFRMVRYEDGGQFLPHFDYGYEFSTTQRTVHTFMLYLDHGSDTVVYNRSQQHYETPDSENEIVRVTPEPGMAIVFQPEITHGGDPVTGVKHILRSEVVYTHHEDDPDQDSTGSQNTSQFESSDGGSSNDDEASIRQEESCRQNWLKQQP